jgi:hypothetical protein
MTMSDQLQFASAPTPAGAPASAAGSAPAVSLDMSHVTTTYVNYFHACGSPRELILDFGLHSGLRLASGTEPVRVTQRLIMPMQTAKHLLEFLHMLVRSHAQNDGPIQAAPPRPSPSPAPPTSQPSP